MRLDKFISKLRIKLPPHAYWIVDREWDTQDSSSQHIVWDSKANCFRGKVCHLLPGGKMGTYVIEVRHASDDSSGSND